MHLDDALEKYAEWARTVTGDEDAPDRKAMPAGRSARAAQNDRSLRALESMMGGTR